jgi:L-threonylcarbamoyladenylate synthase
VSQLATAGLDTIAVRVPDHPVAQDILRGFGKPVVAPSANQSGHVSPTTAAHVLADLDNLIDLILDGGPTSVGVESTIVSCLGVPTLLRPGGVSREAIERTLGRALVEAAPLADEAPLAPGMLASHYAPMTPLRLNAVTVNAGEALLAFGAHGPIGAMRTLNLSTSGDLIEAAANLFAFLRSLDGAGARGIAVMPIPNHGLGEAINDRLARAAAPK